MKLRSFLMGSLVGASAMWVYHNRNHAVVNMMSLVAKDTIKKNQSSEATVQPELNQQSHFENESIIRSIIEQDSELSAHFNAITETTIDAENQPMEQSQSHLQ